MKFGRVFSCIKVELDLNSKMALITLGLTLANVSTPRAAVIPYIIKNSELYFLLGQDKQSGDITDFGGGVKQFETALAAALREFEEESDEILGKLEANDPQISRAIALLGKNMATLFIPLEEEWFEKAPQLFEERKRLKAVKKKSHQEIEKIMWIKHKDFTKLLGPPQQGSPQMWKKLCRFYRDSCNAFFKSALIAAAV